MRAAARKHRSRIRIASSTTPPTLGEQPPRTLWRVQHSGNSLQARAVPDFQDEGEFKYLVKRHLNWRNRESTPFVSAFGNRMHAENWANRLLQNGHSEVCFCTINTARVGPLFRARDLVCWLGININRDPSVFSGELILNEVPSSSIVHTKQWYRGYADDSDSSDSDSYGYIY